MYADAGNAVRPPMKLGWLEMMMDDVTYMNTAKSIHPSRRSRCGFNLRANRNFNAALE